MRRLSTGAADETANRPAGEKLHCQTPTSLLRERVNGCSLYSTSEPLCPDPACVLCFDVLCFALLLTCCYFAALLLLHDPWLRASQADWGAALQGCWFFASLWHNRRGRLLLHYPYLNLMPCLLRTLT